MKKFISAVLAVMMIICSVPVYGAETPESGISPEESQVVESPFGETLDESTDITSGTISLPEKTGGGESPETAPPITKIDASLIQVGDYITMGTYYDAPIVWRCVAIDENGPLMLSDKILCLKA